MANTVDKAIKIFKEEVGYQEKKSNSQLESEHSNVGSANYTKYGKAMGCNGQAWCLAFCEWSMVQAYGESTARKMLNGFSNYTPTGATYFKNIKRWFTEPKVGDFVFFYSSTLKRIAHVGFVYKVDSSKVYTIEGNTSSNATEFERDGGCVAYKEYPLSSSRIQGYGRPLYDAEVKIKETKKETVKVAKTTTSDKDVPRMNVKTNGGELNCHKTKDISSETNVIGQFKNGKLVKVLEKTSTSVYKVKAHDTKDKEITGYVSAKYLV